MSYQIWFVEPDQAVYYSVYQRLFASTYQVTCLPTAEALFENLQQETLPDVIVLEKWLPDMDGIRICQLLQQLRSYHDIPLIVVSEAEGLRDRHDALDYGAFDYIRKPFESSFFRQRIQDALHLRLENQRLAKIFSRPHSEVQPDEKDALTALPGLACLRRKLQEYHALGTGEISLLLLDLDFFTFYNEAFGQDAGDLCLQRLARLLEKIAPEAQYFRYQDDGFALLICPQTRAQALRLARQICERVRLMAIPHAPLTDLPYLTASIGTATLSHLEQSEPDELFAGAEQALFQAKTWGRAQVRQFLEL